MSAPDVLVVGAGITGASAALALVEAGARVEMIDSYGIAAMASGWSLAGVRQSGRHPAELPLARDAVALWPDLARRLGAPTSYTQGGNLRLARSPDEVATIRDLVQDQRAAGLDLTFLSDLEGIREIVPGLSDAVLAASWCPTDGHADPVQTVTAYVRKAESQGLRLSCGERVTGLTAASGRIAEVVTDRRRIAPGAVLLATGLMVNDLLGPLGLALPLRRPIVTVLRSVPGPTVLGPVLGVANADMAARQEPDGRFRVTSGMDDWSGEIADDEGRPVARPVARNIADTVAKVAQVLPAFAMAEIERIWGGVLDLTPDALPVIDRAPGLDNLVVAAGFSGHGFGIGPVTGPLAADLILDRTPRHPLAAFRFDRFSAGTGEDAALTLHG